MSDYLHDHIVPFKASSRSKKEQVAEMFDKIAGRYDLLNHFLSVGIDKTWRKKAIRELEQVHPAAILDVATGTGDLAISMTRRLKPERIVGIDISTGMLELGKRKIAKLRLKPAIELQHGDGEAINFPGASFEAVTVAFGVRNFQNLEKGIAEMHRVLRPGGKLVILEFSKPRKGPFYSIYKTYLRFIAPESEKCCPETRTHTNI